jgi:CheY-like chemotaxis protein
MYRLLIIEDDKKIAQQIRKYLESMDYSVDIASSYEEAIYKMNSFFDLALLDINLPDKDGTSLLAILKNKDIRVIITTVKNDESFIVRTLDSGADDYLTKPFNLDVLRARIDATLRTLPISIGNTIKYKEWNKDILKELRNVMKSNGLADFIYVADSAAVTEDMLKSLAGNGNDELEIPFVTRLPGNYSLENELRSKAYENSKGWEEAGSFSDRENSCKYRVQSFQDELYGKQYRFVVCSSDELDKRKDNLVEGRIEWDDRYETDMPKFIIDGQEYSLEEFGRMMMSCEGWNFKLEIIEPTE